MNDDNGIKLTGDQVIAMYPASVVRGTEAHWPAVAMQWIQKADAEIVRLTAALAEHDAQPAQQEPVAWAWARPDGVVLDVICPAEHDREEGEYTVPLYAAPQPAQQAVGWLNVKYGTFFGAGVIAATDRNEELIASGELIRLYASPK